MAKIKQSYRLSPEVVDIIRTKGEGDMATFVEACVLKSNLPELKEKETKELQNAVVQL